MLASPGHSCSPVIPPRPAGDPADEVPVTAWGYERACGGGSIGRCLSTAGALHACSSVGDFEITTDLASEEIVDLTMARNRRNLPRGPIDVNTVIAALSEQLATAFLEVTNEIAALQAASIRSVSRMT